MERFVDWFFRNHATGEIAVAQFPNAPLWAYFVLTIARLITHPSGGAGTAISVAATVALMIWAVLEVGWGACPFRGVLGAVVLIGEVAIQARSLFP